VKIVLTESWYWRDICKQNPRLKALDQKEKNLHHGDDVDDNTEIWCFSQYLSTETVFFRDFKPRMYQGGDDGEFDVFG
jgi:hypothetical protein